MPKSDKEEVLGDNCDLEAGLSIFRLGCTDPTFPLLGFGGLRIDESLFYSFCESWKNKILWEVIPHHDDTMTLR